MATQERVEQRPEGEESYIGPLASIPSLGFAARGRRGDGNVAWRKTVTQHEPEPWSAVRLALQARILSLG